MFKIEFKKEIDLRDLSRMKFTIIKVLFDFADYCRANDLPCLITSLMEDVKYRKSLTHIQGRAFDASVRGFSEEDIQALLLEFNGKYANQVGTAPKGKDPKVVICHGDAKHLHFQIRRGV